MTDRDARLHLTWLNGQRAATCAMLELLDDAIAWTSDTEIRFADALIGHDETAPGALSSDEVADAQAHLINAKRELRAARRIVNPWRADLETRLARQISIVKPVER